MTQDIAFHASASRRDALALFAAGSVGSALNAGPSLAQMRGTQQALVDDAVDPLSISVAQGAIDDLKRRLDHTRWPEPETATDWSQGVPLAKAQALIAYWRDRYDWHGFEARANRFKHFRTKIDELGIHFIHARSPHAGALPIVLTHGWPGSFIEFMEVVEPLCDPTRHGGSAGDAFHVVVPSLPGFGFSDKPTETGWNVARVAAAWSNLMRRLGYSRWVAQGGDWGSGVTHALARLRPPGLVAAHVNWPLVYPTRPPQNPTPREQRVMDRVAWFANDLNGYFRQQATRPQTIGYPLADSAAGQALWIYEKFQAWTDNRGNAEDALSIDAMLDNISLYWFTNTAASSARLYWENTKAGLANLSAGRIELPMAASIFPAEIFGAPRSWAEDLWSNIFYWNELDRGGHFAAFEQPALFVEEMRKAFTSIRI